MSSRYGSRTRSAGAPSTLCAAAILGVASTAIALAEELVFADGFEVCEAAHWSAATGLPDCTAELTCPTADPDEACVAGRLLDVETSKRLCSSPVVSTQCTSGLQGGPCELQLRVFDAIELIQNPGTAAPIAAPEILVDGCGRFRISGFDAPNLGFGAIRASDDGETFVQHVPSADVRPVESGAEIEGIRLYVVRTSTDLAWTTTAGSPFEDDTFSDVGAFVPIFRHAGVPVAGVQILVDSAGDPDDDYYFSDIEPLRRSVVAIAMTSAGANGTGIHVTSSITNTSGSGSEPEGCEWPTILAGAAPGLVVVKELEAQVDDQPGTPCP